MRFVIYDDETMEPITVVNLPGVAERDILERGERWRVPLPQEDGCFAVLDDTAPPTPRVFPWVELRFERFIRRGQTALMCFTREAELALLIEPEFLPGQRGKIRDLQQQNGRLSEMLLQTLFDR